MNETSQELVKVACDAILTRHALVNHPLTVETVAAVVTATVLQKLSDMMDEADDEQVDWPDAGDLALLARDVRESL